MCVLALSKRASEGRKRVGSTPDLDAKQLLSSARLEERRWPHALTVLTGPRPASGCGFPRWGARARVGFDWKRREPEIRTRTTIVAIVAVTDDGGLSSPRPLPLYAIHARVCPHMLTLLTLVPHAFPTLYPLPPQPIPFMFSFVFSRIPRGPNSNADRGRATIGRRSSISARALRMPSLADACAVLLLVGLTSFTFLASPAEAVTCSDVPVGSCASQVVTVPHLGCEVSPATGLCQDVSRPACSTSAAADLVYKVGEEAGKRREALSFVVSFTSSLPCPPLCGRSTPHLVDNSPSLHPLHLILHTSSLHLFTPQPPPPPRRAFGGLTRGRPRRRPAPRCAPEPPCRWSRRSSARRGSSTPRAAA